MQGFIGKIRPGGFKTPNTMQEIERKFLVNSLPALELAHTKTYIKQAYLSVDPERTVRIRQTNTSGWITIKGQSTQKGLVRFEWEKQISDEDAQALAEYVKQSSQDTDNSLSITNNSNHQLLDTIW